MCYEMPRLVIAALSGGAGKTMISAGLSRALFRRGYKVQSFKKGPDYIDTLWLSLATGYSPRNLDPFMADPELLPYFFEHACKNNSVPPDIAIIEGNRGLFDGLNISGDSSTAFLAHRLEAPVLLTMNCSKMTRTAAAIALGCKNFDPDIRLAGVIINQASRQRHRAMLKEAVETLAALPVLGMLPRLDDAPFDERYSGLYGAEAVCAGEKAHARLDKIADLVEEYIDIDAIVKIARTAPPLLVNKRPQLYHDVKKQEYSAALKPRIGYVRDAALWFYYTENLEALSAAGAELIELTLFGEKPWPKLDGLYLGGGCPGDFAPQLSANLARQKEVLSLLSSGLPTYAEGAGFYYLAANLDIQGQQYPMCGVFDFSLSLGKTPQGIGYVQAVAEKSNPFHPVGTAIKAHEFHYGGIILNPAMSANTLLRMEKGTGLVRNKNKTGRDGLLSGNCFISHMQLFAPGVPHWAPNFVKAAATWANNGRSGLIIAE